MKIVDLRELVGFGVQRSVWNEQKGLGGPFREDRVAEEQELACSVLKKEACQ